jgi:hypothetical protein
MTNVGEKHVNVLLNENAHRLWSAASHEDTEASVLQYFRDRSTD